jgi:hypothetical protein
MNCICARPCRHTHFEISAQILASPPRTPMRRISSAASRPRLLAGAAAGRFDVWRQDTHGNSVRIKRFADRRSADDEIARLEEQPHKQHYWVSAARELVNPQPQSGTTTTAGSSPLGKVAAGIASWAASAVSGSARGSGKAESDEDPLKRK